MNGENAILITAQNSLQLLKLFSYQTPELGVCEISHRTRLSKSTVSRMVSTYVEESILEKNAKNGKYRLSPVMLELGLIAGEVDPVIQHSRNEIDNLSRVSGCDASLYIREGTEAVCLYTSCSGKEGNGGQRTELPFTVSGWVILSFLEEGTDVEEAAGFEDGASYGEFSVDFVRRHWPAYASTSDGAELGGRLKRIEQEGYASGMEPCNPSRFSLSCPIFDSQGTVVCAISITTEVEKKNLCQSFLLVAGKTAQRISKGLPI